MRKRSKTVRPKKTSAKKTRVVSKASAGPFSLPAECTLADAAELKTRLAKLLQSVKPVTLDVAAVQRVDTASMQVLTAFVRQRQERGRAVVWSGDSPAFTQAARILGIDTVLGLTGNAQ